MTTQGRIADAGPDQITASLAAARESGFWLDIAAPGEDDYRLLEDLFKFHPLTIEDVRQQNQRPKVDEYPDYNFAVVFQADWSAVKLRSLSTTCSPARATW